jgi:ATP-binding cassette, subfamily B, multidrug efflux pump
MSNNQYRSLKKEKTKISWFYLFRKFTPQTLLHYLFGTFSAFLNVQLIGIVSKIIGEGSVSYLKSNLLQVMGCLILYAIIVFTHIALGQYLEELYASYLRRKLAQEYLRANFSQTQKTKFILSNYENDAITVGIQASRIFNRCFYAAVSIILLFLKVGSNEKQNWLIPWIFFALLGLALVATLLYQLAYYYRKKRNLNIHRENKQFEEIKNNIEYIKVSGSEKIEMQKNRASMKKTAKSLFPLALAKSLYGTIPNYIILDYAPVILLLLAGEKTWAALYIPLKELFSQWKKLFEMLWAYGGYDTYCSSLKQLNNAFAILEKNTDFSTKSFQKTLPAKNPNITFQNVNFAYPETHKKILDNFSFNFQNGKKYAIIGPNGIGKSTLFKLIVKLYQPQQGIIKLNDSELKKVDNSALRKKISYLPNNPSFFNANLGDNIVYPETYQENIHKEKLEQITKKLGIREFIDQLPNRWETVISEKGQNLSEGQKQIVSLMRALVRDYEIYLFDEFLSNVSSELKRKILKVIFSELKNKTIIIISHDEETLSYADEIYKFTPKKLEKEIWKKK